MRSARLTNIVQLQQNVEAPDPRTGQKKKQWETKYTVWVGIEPLRGKELYAAQQHNSEIALRIVMRWNHAIAAELDHTWSVFVPENSSLQQPECRYQILHNPINPNMSNRELHLMCKVLN